MNEDAISNMNRIWNILNYICEKNVDQPEFICSKCILQKNLVDCGLHVIANALSPQGGEGDITIGIDENYRSYLCKCLQLSIIIKYDTYQSRNLSDAILEEEEVTQKIGETL